jgi:hypothetical protein
MGNDPRLGASDPVAGRREAYPNEHTGHDLCLPICMIPKIRDRLG